jgi:hypothetical protein
MKSHNMNKNTLYITDPRHPEFRLDSIEAFEEFGYGESQILDSARIRGLDQVKVRQIADDLKLNHEAFLYFTSILTNLKGGFHGKKKKGSKPSNETLRKHAIDLLVQVGRVSELVKSKEKQRRVVSRLGTAAGRNFKFGELDIWFENATVVEGLLNDILQRWDKLPINIFAEVIPNQRIGVGELIGLRLPALYLKFKGEKLGLSRGGGPNNKNQGGIKFINNCLVAMKLAEMNASTIATHVKRGRSTNLQK